tara:strand:+ start:1362 stop:2006 length:645 start_codon:yes stop_codon:yes gene_type:complete
MISNNFKHVNNWVFDLDNTLYSPKVCLFDQIEKKMTDWISQKLSIPREAADILRSDYWKKYGTSLAGLMREHQIEPEEYLSYVHDICFDNLAKNPELKNLIENLPGRKIVYTNGTAPYAKNVLSALGLLDVFSCIYGVEDANYNPKPEYKAYELVFKKDGLNPLTSAMFEDEPRNLKVPHQLGMKTIFVSPESKDEHYIDFHTSKLSGFLKHLI